MKLVAFEDVQSLVRSSRRFIVTTHVHPDGDAIGSAVALALQLRALNKDVRVIIQDEVPENLAFLARLFPVERHQQDKHRDAIGKADVVFFLDLNGPSRVGGMEAPLCGSSAVKIVIDHHLDPRPFADGYLIDETACATADILFRYFDADPAFRLTAGIAEALYTGIMTDTGSFRFERTTPGVHRIAATLLEAGIDPQAVYSRIHDEYPMARTLLLGQILSRMEGICEGRATILTVTREMLASTGTGEEDVENIVNFGLGIRGVSATALLAELDEGIKISFRSRGAIRVRDLAASFGGGGHAYAAGATVRGATLQEVRSRLEQGLSRLFDAPAQ